MSMPLLRLGRPRSSHGESESYSHESSSFRLWRPLFFHLSDDPTMGVSLSKGSQVSEDGQDDSDMLRFHQRWGFRGPAFHQMVVPGASHCQRPTTTTRRRPSTTTSWTTTTLPLRATLSSSGAERSRWAATTHRILPRYVLYLVHLTSVIAADGGPYATGCGFRNISTYSLRPTIAPLELQQRLSKDPMRRFSSSGFLDVDTRRLVEASGSGSYPFRVMPCAHIMFGPQGVGFGMSSCLCDLSWWAWAHVHTYYESSNRQSIWYLFARAVCPETLGQSLPRRTPLTPQSVHVEALVVLPLRRALRTGFALFFVCPDEPPI
ncbi:hypothetical protein C8Q76DRAFT_61127 [Earliella scabrosa]|nr:hypothetical protein C8Q76DRAFT_61127 [Earliella scabrosa]